MVKRPVALFVMLLSISSILPIVAIGEGLPQENHRTISLTRGPQPDQTPGEGWQPGERHPMTTDNNDTGDREGTNGHRPPPPRRDMANRPGNTERPPANHPPKEGPPPRDFQAKPTESAESNGKPEDGKPFHPPPRDRQGYSPSPDRNNGSREIPPEDQ